MNAELQSLREVQGLSREEFLVHARRWYEDSRRQIPTPEKKLVRFPFKRFYWYMRDFSRDEDFLVYCCLNGAFSLVLVLLAVPIINPAMNPLVTVPYMIGMFVFLMLVGTWVNWRTKHVPSRDSFAKASKADTAEREKLPPSDNDLWFLYWTHQVQELREGAKQLLAGPAAEIRNDIDTAQQNKCKLAELLRTITDTEFSDYLTGLQQEVDERLKALNRERVHINELRDKIISLAQSLESRVTAARSKYDMLAEVEDIVSWLGEVSGRSEERQRLLSQIEFELVASCVRLANLVSSFEMLSRVDIALAQEREGELFEASMDRLERVAEYPEIPESLFEDLDMAHAYEQGTHQSVLC